MPAFALAFLQKYARILLKIGCHHKKAPVIAVHLAISKQCVLPYDQVRRSLERFAPKVETARLARQG
jgi:hypothetical protein